MDSTCTDNQISALNAQGERWREQPAERCNRTDSPVAADDVDALLLAEDVVSFMRSFIAHSGLWVGGNEKLYPRAESSAVVTMEFKKARYRAAPISIRRLINRASEFSMLHGLPFKKADLIRGYDLAVHSLAGERREQIWEPISPIALSDEERDRAEAQFARFATLIEAPERISIYSLKHWIWMTKRKGGLNEPISDHLMLIFLNPTQGTGKTEFVRRLLAPLAEVASAPVNFTQVADDRSGELFSNAAINIDDLGYLHEKLVSDLKTVMTSEYQLRRVLGSSVTELVRQRASFIGTSNRPISELVPDNTGHRRFVMLPLRNGCVERGGSADVWKTVNELDFALMWRSVPEHVERGPIKDIMEELVSYQARWIPVDSLLAWLRKIDRNAYSIRHISRPGGVKARELWELFVEETSSEMSEKAFAAAMKRYFNDGGVPFRAKKRIGSGNLYLWKPEPNAAACATSEVSAQ
jgi:hypothetical protein